MLIRFQFSQLVRLQVTKEFYDEVICELVTLYCRHQPRLFCSRLKELSRKPAGRHLARVRFANEMRKGGVGGGRRGKLPKNHAIPV